MLRSSVMLAAISGSMECISHQLRGKQTVLPYMDDVLTVHALANLDDPAQHLPSLYQNPPGIGQINKDL